MRKGSLVLAMLMVVSAPAIAAAKKGKSNKLTQPVAVIKPVNVNEASARLVGESLPLFLPSWAMPIYFANQAPAKK